MVLTLSDIKATSGVELLDKDENLELYSYQTCTEMDSDVKKYCRGLVFKGEKLVLASFPFTLDLKDTETERVKSLMTDLKQYTVFNSYEGCILRVFYSDKWYVSTHRKLDAFNSRWSSSTSFGTRFSNILEYYFATSDDFKKRLENTSPDASILERFFETLDKDNKYIFLLPNSEDNRIVSEAKNKLIHVATFKPDLDEKSVTGFKSVFDVDVGLPLAECLNFSNCDELLKYVRSLDHKLAQGVVIFGEGLKSYKIYNSKYLKLFNLRDNEPNIVVRYLELRNEPDSARKFKKLYPEHRVKFTNCETLLNRLSTYLWNTYKERYMMKNYLYLRPQYHYIIKQCNLDYLQTRERTNVLVVKNMIDKQSPTTIYKLLKLYSEDSKVKF